MSESTQPKRRIKKPQNPESVEQMDWGESSTYGYKSDDERKDRRGLEDWEMLESMENSTVGIPFWFIAIFVVLLVVAVGLTFPFWGNRPGYERPWFDWGIPAGVAWVVLMSAIIYYFVEMVPARRQKKEKAEAELAAKLAAEDGVAEASVREATQKQKQE